MIRNAKQTTIIRIEIRSIRSILLGRREPQREHGVGARKGDGLDEPSADSQSERERDGVDHEGKVESQDGRQHDTKRKYCLRI